MSKWFGFDQFFFILVFIGLLMYVLNGFLVVCSSQFLTLPEIITNVLHHQWPNVGWCVQCRMWVTCFSPGTKETVYTPTSVCLISAAESFFIWRWNNHRIKTHTDVCSTILQANRLNISTSHKPVRDVKVRQHINWGWARGEIFLAVYLSFKQLLRG